VTLTFDLESESRVTWATSMPILVFLGLSVLELDPMYATDRRQTKTSLNAPAYYRSGGINWIYMGPYGRNFRGTGGRSGQSVFSESPSE